MKEYVEGLKRANGLELAYKIAERCKRASSPTGWHELPMGDVFFPKDKRGGLGKANAKLNAVHQFWTHVVGILNKDKGWRKK